MSDSKSEDPVAALTAKERKSTEGGNPGFKISGLGWLCVWDGRQWIALFQLTTDQLREYRYWRESA